MNQMLLVNLILAAIIDGSQDMFSRKYQVQQNTRHATSLEHHTTSTHATLNTPTHTTLHHTTPPPSQIPGPANSRPPGDRYEAATSTVEI